ncbi:alpha/beta fold hydrolase [Actinosynnema sp. CA-248983]
MVLVHGIDRSLEDWQAAQDRLAADFRVISMDLPGLGLTPKLEAKPGLPTFARAVVGVRAVVGARAVVGVLDALGDRDTVLPVGHFHAAVAALPDARGHLFPATGHMPQIERVEEFTAPAADFVSAAAVP